MGASGSIGTQTIDVIKQHPDELKLVGVSVGKNIDYLTMPGYPTNRDTFRAGLAWHFYN